jgi:hypothetical protein
MKVLAIRTMVVVACLGMLSLVEAQTPPGTGKPISEGLPRPVCKAMEAYLAAIDVAKSDVDRGRRQQKYDKARAELEAVLKPYGKEALLTEALQYALYSEAAVSRDATDPQLNEIIEKRVKLRADLLELCTGYTISR